MSDKTTVREIVARAIWEDRYPDDSWEEAKYLATETPDGGNGRYLTITGHADAALNALVAAGFVIIGSSTDD